MLTGVWVSVALFLAGLVLIVKGGDWFLDGAVWMAEASGVPRFLIGATVVSLATTLPELTVSLTGVLRGARDLAVGNAVGSVAANLGLILGIGVLWAPGTAARRQLAPRANSPSSRTIRRRETVRPWGMVCRRCSMPRRASRMLPAR